MSIIHFGFSDVKTFISFFSKNFSLFVLQGSEKVILYKKEKNKETKTMKEEKNYFASNLRFLRQKNGLEQIDLATRLGRKSSSSISEWEKGKYTPKAGVLNDIANIFGVSLSKLMSTDLSNPSAQVEEEENSTFKMIQRKAKNLSVTDQERLLQIMELTFQDISNGGVEDDHDF